MEDQLHLVFAGLAVFVAILAVIPLTVQALLKLGESDVADKRESWEKAGQRLGLEYQNGSDRSSMFGMRSGLEATIAGEVDGRSIEGRVRRHSSPDRHKTFEFSTIVDAGLEADLWNEDVELTARIPPENWFLEKVGISLSSLGPLARFFDRAPGEPLSLEGTGDLQWYLDGEDADRVRARLEDDAVETALTELADVGKRIEISEGRLEVRVWRYMIDPDEIVELVERIAGEARRLDRAAATPGVDQKRVTGGEPSGMEPMFPEVD